MTPIDPAKLKTTDVSHLPSTLLDDKSPIWWGNLWGLMIETAAFGIVVTAWFSVRMFSSSFPPPRVDRMPVLYDSSPDLTLPTIGLMVLLLSLIPGVWLDISARKKNEGAAKVLLIITLVFGIAAIVIRYYEFDSLHFKWDDNAYASVVWMILGLHMIHMIALTVEDVMTLSWVVVKGLDDKHSLDITVVAVYWYWIVGTWVLLYFLVYWGPRIL